MTLEIGKFYKRKMELGKGLYLVTHLWIQEKTESGYLAVSVPDNAPVLIEANCEKVSNPEFGGSRYNCARCPLKWPSSYHELMCLHENEKMESDGLYEQCMYQSHPYVANYEKTASIAREIANLPERKIEEE